jgi:hypothetical protein
MIRGIPKEGWKHCAGALTRLRYARDDQRNP